MGRTRRTVPCAFVYQYDKGGNRVSEKIYAYTLSDSLGTVQQEIVSEYDNLVWDDLLTSYNGKAITYDNAGNPLTYDGQTYTWNGKQLTMIKAADGSKTIFSYDANGFRTKKTQYNADGTLSYYVEYIWSDGKIVSQFITLIMRGTIGNEYKVIPIGPIPSKIIYDDNGIPQGFTCGEANFGFVRNLQGDVIAMVDFEGNIVMEYSYDPWGNIEYHLNEEFTTEEEAMMITALCPLTYRGYNYDFTTGLYYLQSRYYNPEWGRFLNCDDTAILLSTQGETHNANLFAYCANNPVNRVDKTGYDSEELTAEELALIFVSWVALAELYAMGYEDYFEYEIFGINYSIDKFGLYHHMFIFKTGGFFYKYEGLPLVFGDFEAWSKFAKTEKPIYKKESQAAITKANTNFYEFNRHLLKDADIGPQNGTLETPLTLTAFGLTALVYGDDVIRAYYNAEKYYPYSQNIYNGKSAGYSGMSALYSSHYFTKSQAKKFIKKDEVKINMSSFNSVQELHFIK